MYLSLTLLDVMNNHARSHTGEKLYSCEVCRKGFTTKTVMNKPIRIHAREKRFRPEQRNQSNHIVMGEGGFFWTPHVFCDALNVWRQEYFIDFILVQSSQHLATCYISCNVPSSAVLDFVSLLQHIQEHEVQEFICFFFCHYEQ